MFINNIRNKAFIANNITNEKEQTKNKDNSNKKSIQVEKDSVNISKRGKENNVLLSLIKQKEEILSKRSEMLAKLNDKAEDKEVIDERVKGLNELLKYIEKQIQDRMKAEEEAKRKEAEERNYPKPRTKEEAEARRLHSLVRLGSRLRDGKVQVSMKARVDGEISQVKTEEKLDSSRSDSPNLGKEGYLEKLEARSGILGAEIEDTLDEVSKHIKFANAMTKEEKALEKKEKQEKEKKENIKKLIKNK